MGKLDGTRLHRLSLRHSPLSFWKGQPKIFQQECLVSDMIIVMKKKIYTADELNNASRDELMGIISSLQETIVRMAENQDLILEQAALLRQQRFGRHSEKMDVTDGQISLFFNEPEAAADEPDGQAKEPEFEKTVVHRKKKQKGKREDDLKGIPATAVRHEMTEDGLKAAFADGKYRRLPDEVYKRLEFHPASFEVMEHHAAVYVGMDNETIVKAGRPKDLLRDSMVTPSLQAVAINGKYVNSLRLCRMEQEFKRNGVNISRQNMANWTIQCASRCPAILYGHLHKLLYGCHVLQADETPMETAKDGRPAGSKSYMWVYRTGKNHKEVIVLYEYQKDRKVEHLLTEIPKHEDDTDLSFLDGLLPWFPNLPERYRKTNKYEVK